jgi:regulatory protein
MPTITSLKPQVRKNRVNVYLDEVFGFGIDLENLVKLKLFVGNEYTQEEIEKIIEIAEYQKTADKLLSFALLRPRSKKEITDWFRRKEVHSSLYDQLYEKLVKLDLLDDTKFAIWWVSQRSQFKPKPKNVLTGELLRKGISTDIIKKVLSELVVDEVGQAKVLLQKRQQRWLRFEKKDRYMKQYRFLASKGYSSQTIKKVLEST